MKILAAYENTRHSKPIEYTLRFCLAALDEEPGIIPYEKIKAFDADSIDLLLTYGKVPPQSRASRSLHIYESDFFLDSYLKPQSLPPRPIPTFRDLPILFLAKERSGEPLRRIDKKRTEIGIDMIASIFFLLSRYEEFIVRERDEHGRFAAVSSLAMKEGFLDRPLVNEYLEMLYSAIGQICPECKPKPLWQGKDFCSVISFDVDAPFKYHRWSPISLPGGLLRWEKSLREVVRSTKEAIEILSGRKRDPYFVFEYLAEQLRRCSARATYFFLCERTSRWDPNPQFKRPEVQTLLRQLHDQDCEVGLHGSYRSLESVEQLQQEKERLEESTGRKVNGVRQHFLRLEVPRTWRLQEKAGLHYDATLGFADAEGFRASICQPYRPFDLEENCERKIWTVPLCVMDATLKYYRGSTPEEARERIFKIVDAVKRRGGVFTLLWHNSSFDERHWLGWREVFESVLQYLAEQNSLSLTAEQLIERMQKVYKPLPEG